ncbi:MAG TPA: hypothetical protein VGM88_12905 [Kofleriaceae bacterium]
MAAPVIDVPYREAQEALFAMARIFEGNDASEVDASCGAYQVPLWQLYDAVIGSRHGEHLSARTRRELFAAGTRGLQSAIDRVNTTAEGSNWVRFVVRPYWFDASSYEFSAAAERVQSAVVLSGKAIEMPRDGEPREEGSALRTVIEAYVPAVRALDEQLIHLGEHVIEHEVKELLAHGKAHGQRGRLAEIANVLMLADAWLTLSDKELTQHLGEINNAFDGVATYGELVKAVTELLAGAVGVTAQAIAFVAQAGGNAGIAATATALARNVGVTFGDVVAGVEVVIGAAELLDPDSTTSERLDAGFHVATGLGWLAGRYVAQEGAAAAASATLPLFAGYYEWKLAVDAYGRSAIGLDSFLSGEAFQALARIGAHVLVSSRRLETAMCIERDEPRASMRADLHLVTERAMYSVAVDIEDLLIACQPPRQIEAGVASDPGAWPLFVELFTPLRAYRNPQTPARAMEAATLALTKLAWVNRHAELIVEGSVMNQSLETVELDARRMDMLARWKEGDE